MTLSTVPGIVVCGGAGVRSESKARCAILAELDMRGFAISLRTLARIARSSSFFPTLLGIHPLWS